PAGALHRGHVLCPFCLRLVETSLIGLSTLLGPSLLRCRKCDRLFTSHRSEWRDRGSAGRTWYVALSIVHVVLGAAASFVITWCACAIARAPLDWPPAAAAAFWGTAVAALQITRVVRSLRRTSRVEREAHRAGFWSLDLYLPQKVAAGMCLSA